MGKKEEELIGFQVREDGFAHCTVTVDAIRQFPRPPNVPGVESMVWTGGAGLVRFLQDQGDVTVPGALEEGWEVLVVGGVAVRV